MSQQTILSTTNLPDGRAMINANFGDLYPPVEVTGVTFTGTIADGKWVYHNRTTGEWDLLDASAEATAGPVEVGVKIAAAIVQKRGVYATTGETPGIRVAGTTAGDASSTFSETDDHVRRYLGYQRTATELVIDPDPYYTVNATSTALESTDIDTLAELNAILTDATLIDTADARLSDARTPTAHTHTLSEVTDAGTAAALDVAATGDAAVGEVVKGDDTRLSDDRAPTAHTHTASEVTDFAAEVAANSAVALNTAKVTNATHTGDVTGATALTIADEAVTYAKMQNVSATDKLLGRSTAGAGDVEEIACTAAGRALLDDADAAAQRTTLGLDKTIDSDTTEGGSGSVAVGNIVSISQANYDLLTPDADTLYIIV